jgi:hypothetical protein
MYLNPAVGISRLLRYAPYAVLIYFLAFQGVYSNTSFAGVGINRIVEFVFFAFVAKSFLVDMQHNKVITMTVRLLAIFGLLLCLKIFVIFVFEAEIDMSLFKDLIRLPFIIFPFYLVFYLMNRGVKIVQLLLLINFPIMLVAFFQAQITPFTDLAWDLKFNTFGANSVGIDDTPWFRARVTGLYPTSITLAYALVSNIILSSYLYVKSRNSLYLLYFFFLGLICFLSLTRSAVLSWAIMLLYLGYKSLMVESLIQKVVAAGVLSALLLYGLNVYTENISTFSRVTSTEDKSAEGRIPLALTGIYTLAHYPLGISETSYSAAKKEMFDIFHVANILIYESHNGFINIGFEYTLFGLFFFALYLWLLHSMIKKHFSKELQGFFRVSFFAYAANAFFHNNIIFIQDFSALSVLALVAYEYTRHSDKEKLHVQN